MSQDSTNEPGQAGPRFTHWEASSMEPTSRAWAERRRLAAAMRSVIERLLASDAPADELAKAADNLERYADHLLGQARKIDYEGFAETSPSGDAAAFFDRSPIIGLANPLAPPIDVESDRESGRVRGRVTFGSAYEGPPGCVHGGWVAAAFDEVLGFANSLSGTPGMTAHLSVQYRKPTPLHKELRFEATLDRTEGRKIWCSGQVYADDVMTAESEGLFVAFQPEKFRALMEARRKHDAAQSQE